MRWILMVLLGLVALSGAQAGECLSVSDNALEELRTEYGMTTVEWSAMVSNSCDASYDGTLTVQLVDSEGGVLHESLEVIILKQNASEQASRRITLPEENYRALDDIKVEIRERKRPS